MDNSEAILNNPYLYPTFNHNHLPNINFEQLFGTVNINLSPQAQEVVATIYSPIVYTYEHENIENESVELFIFLERGDGYFQFNKYTRPEFELGVGGAHGNQHEYQRTFFRDEDLNLILDITRDWQREM